ncbi:MAG TPA: alpha/beta hydrolase [Pseudonocardiaceae bacterium]|nr:alpha/beta hydrolase [Pseudonocardiaceae bacterium]
MRLFHNGHKRRLPHRIWVTALIAVTAGLLVAPAPADASPVSCRDVYVPISLLGLPQTMYGRLCAPAGATTVQLLEPGGSYNSSYWDIGYTPWIRSYRLAMNNAGYATLAVDRLGTGRTSKPPSALITASTEAAALHQVVQALRTGRLGTRFDKVIIGGHSIGSAMVMIEAGTYHDVDGVLVTGMTHQMNFTTVAGALAKMMPAMLDPKFADLGVDPGYLTTDPGTRYSDFHSPGPYVTGAIAFDESTKDVFTVTEAVDSLALTTVVIPISRRITAPVLIVMGDDPNFCGPPLGSDCASPATLRQSEAPYYPAAASLRTFVLHGYGHAINYAPNAPVYFQQVVNWANGLG